ncbi:hypothetical protein [Neotabrizicola sp. VNH66]|uniref:hypothetical protein n=1 Tax=Neotabrizicola sp. VNH66 TaxID=3400918 RepID=UPI003BFE7182
MFLKSSITALAVSVIASVPASADSAPKGALHVAPDENLPVSASTLTPIYTFKMIDEAFGTLGDFGQIADIRGETPTGAVKLMVSYNNDMTDGTLKTFDAGIAQLADTRGETPTGAMNLIAKYLPETSGEAFGTLGDFGQIADIRGETPTDAMRLMVSYNYDMVDGMVKTFDADIAQLADTRGETPTGAMKLIPDYLAEASAEGFGTLGDFGQIANIQGGTPIAVKLIAKYGIGG